MERPLGRALELGLGLSTAGLGPIGCGLVLAGTKSTILGVFWAFLLFSRFLRWTLNLSAVCFDINEDVDDDVNGMRLTPGPALCERR